jgi:hypothetical protein
MKKFSFLLFFILLPSLIFSQTDCSNIGFELGNITGWTLSNGTLTDDGTKAIYGTKFRELLIKLSTLVKDMMPILLKIKFP